MKSARSKAVVRANIQFACQVHVGGLCLRTATHLLLVSENGGTWVAHPRCGQHPVADAVTLLERVMPEALWVSVSLPAVQLAGDLAAATPGR